MKTITSLKTLAFGAALLAGASLQADVVQTKDGSRLVGTVSKIDGGKVTLTTAYAGDVVINQADVVSIETEKDIAVRLVSGTRIDGKLSGSAGAVDIASKDGAISSSVDKIAASWTAGAEDPSVTAMRRHWRYQATADIVGKDGNTKSTGMGLGFVASLVSPQDALKFYLGYNYATTTSALGVETKSADETKGGVDYSAFFSPRMGWYVRTELEKDSVEGIDLRSTTDAGLSYRFIKKANQTLTGRAGVGYRFESYPIGPDNKGAVVSLALNHSIVMNSYASLITDLQYVPAVDDFADYRFNHDSALELPIASGFWKLRIGLSNQYNSRPIAGRENLDTTYYTRLLLDWK